MIGNLILLGLSWLLLYGFKKQHLNALGIIPTPTISRQFLAAFVFSALLCAAVQYIDAASSGVQWQLNENFRAGLLLQGFWQDLQSVLFEELIFRGAILYLLIQWGGRQRALWISAVAFGVYHWFSYGILGQLVPMVVILLGTGLMGYAWALAFIKTRSILVPLALHLGWNFVYNSIFSRGPWGDMLLVTSGTPESSALLSTLVGFFLPMLIVPVLQLLYVHYLIRPTEADNGQLDTTIT